MAGLRRYPMIENVYVHRALIVFGLSDKPSMESGQDLVWIRLDSGQYE